MERISYDPRGAFIEQNGISPDDVAGLSGRLREVRQEMLDELKLWHAGGHVPKEKQPLDAAFMDLPERLLAEYRKNAETSEVGRIQAAARRLAGRTDRVVVLGIGGSYMGVRALLESLCHPYRNELDRERRGGWPRLYFEGNNVDNDVTVQHLDMLLSHGADSSAAGRWGIVVISKSGGTLETAVAFRQYLDALRQSLGDAGEELGRLVIPVTGKEGKLFELSQALGTDSIFHVPDGVGGRFSVLSAVGLLPAALMGIDIVQLLEGAAAMNEHFRTADPGDNVVLDYTAVCHLMEEKRGAEIRVLSTWGKRLEATGLWYDQLLSESLGKTDDRGATPLTCVNTRDLHSRGQQHQEGRRDKLFTNLYVAEPSERALAVGTSDCNQDKLNELSDKTLPEILQAAMQGTNEAYAEARRPTTNLRLPRLDAGTMGQGFQMFMLATVAEGRLIGVNPYGQPGVEAYKRNMNRILRGENP